MINKPFPIVPALLTLATFAASGLVMGLVTTPIAAPTAPPIEAPTPVRETLHNAWDLSYAASIKRGIHKDAAKKIASLCVELSKASANMYTFCVEPVWPVAKTDEAIARLTMLAYAAEGGELPEALVDRSVANLVTRFTLQRKLAKAKQSL